jgi:hypothetical protein
MNLYRRVIIVILGIIFIGFTSTQSVFPQSLVDDRIMSSMRDELQRNFDGIAEGRNEKPFFISYLIANARNTSVSASLGAISNSNRQCYKDWQVRLMIGDYEISDENFNYAQPDEMIFERSIPMPVDNDYNGIRRSLWMTSNNIYESAATTYKNKIALIQHKQLGDSSLEIADFSHAPVVKMQQPAKISQIDQTQLEQKAREYSSIFKNYPDVFSSGISFNVFESMVYFVNSEGTEIQFPFNITTLSIVAVTMSKDSERMTRDITYTVELPDSLPSDESIKSDIYMLIDNLLELKGAERFEDDYTGPVLMEGEAVAENMERFLFGGPDALIAYRENLESSDQMNIYFQHNTNSLQSKINKQIISKDLTITALPFCSEYLGKNLLGTFNVDAEGVIPPANLILVENGVLKSLLNGRTPSRYIPESNGHMRFSYNSRGISGQVGPGVIKISSSTTYSMDELKKELLKQAKEQGLEYAILIRSLKVGGAEKPHNYYKVSVETGEETILRSVRIKNLSLQSLRRSPKFANTEIVHNTLLAIGSDESRGETGVPSSFIVPEAMLISEIEMESYRKPLTSMLPIIDNPVGMKSREGKTMSKINKE